MKSFFKMMFASTLGVFIAGFILIFLSFLILVGIAASVGSEPKYALQKNTVLKIDLNGTISERENQNPFDFLLSNTSLGNYGLNDILSAIKKAKNNDRIAGIYVSAGHNNAGYASMEPIRKALEDFKESGKFVVAYGENFSQRSYYAASVADDIFINPEGTFDFRGLRSSIQFSKNTLEKWGIQMQVFKVGTYKSAVEPYMLDKMSDANREQVTAFLNDIWSNMLAGISESRNISVEQLNKYADEFLLFADPQKLVEYNLVDGLKYSDEVEEYLKEKAGLGANDKLKLAGVHDMRSVTEKKTISKDKIAVLYAEGEIVGDAADMGGMFPKTVITAKEYVAELNKLKKDDAVKAVVFRVNSPGGSAYASEQIWHAVSELKAVKPVVVSMGDYAASGGYYISCNASKIIAEPTTLTGSIGIFGLIPNGAQLAKKMGATFDGVSTNKHSDVLSDVLSIPLVGIGLLPARPLNSEECALLQAYIERGYNTFIDHCAAGRGKTTAGIDSIGQGRVWTGKQALELGLVDALGGIDDAILAAAELANTSKYAVSEYPATKDFFSQFMKNSAEGVGIKLKSVFVGKETLEQKKLLKAWQSFDYRQAIMEVQL